MNRSVRGLLLYLLLVYRKAIDFCKLIVYPATLVKLLIAPRGFLIEFWDLLFIISSANTVSLTSPNSIFKSFLFPSLALLLHLVLQAQYWRGVGIMDGPEIFSDFPGIALSFSLFRIALIVFLICSIYCSEVGYLLSEGFFYICWSNWGFFVPWFVCWLVSQFVHVVYYIISLYIVNHTCISGIKPTGSWWIIFLMYVCIWCASILLSIKKNLCSLGILAHIFS